MGEYIQRVEDEMNRLKKESSTEPVSVNLIKSDKIKKYEKERLTECIEMEPEDHLFLEPYIERLKETVMKSFGNGQLNKMEHDNYLKILNLESDNLVKVKSA